MSDTFAVGDVVHLKSGGGTMTVEKIGEPGSGFEICCVCKHKTTIARHVFSPEVLQKYMPPNPSPNPSPTPHATMAGNGVVIDRTVLGAESLKKRTLLNPGPISRGTMGARPV